MEGEKRLVPVHPVRSTYNYIYIYTYADSARGLVLQHGRRYQTREFIEGHEFDYVYPCSVWEAPFSGRKNRGWK